MSFKNVIFVAKIYKYGIFVAKIYKYALIDSFQESAGSLDSAASCAALKCSAGAVQHTEVTVVKLILASAAVYCLHCAVQAGVTRDSRLTLRRVIGDSVRLLQKYTLVTIIIIVT